MHPYITTLLQCIQLEEKEQANKYRMDQQHSLKALKAEGLALHPIIVTRRTFDYADYPEISFRLGFPPESNAFKDGAAIECFCAGEEPVKGILLSMNGKTGEFRLFAPDFPDWIEDDGVGIKLSPDTRTTTIMKATLKSIENNRPLFTLFEQLHGGNPLPNTAITHTVSIQTKHSSLNDSQRQAVEAIVNNPRLTIVHGPPGTGKTTTLIEAIEQLIKQGEKILVAAPSNTAVDNIVKGLLRKNISVLRVGNTSKVDAAVYPHTPAGKLHNSKLQKEIKQLKIRAEEFRKMALKYKRSFGKAEREQRDLLFKEVKSIRDEIKKIQQYNEEKLFSDASVIAGTPIGIYDADVKNCTFQTLIIDEAGQCIEPLAWCVFSWADKIVLAGDHLQLPPTVVSNDAARLGFSRSILEVAIATNVPVFLLNTQYRMRTAIAGFCSTYFYNGLLQTAAHLQNNGTHISFIDTAGSGHYEERGNDGISLQNNGELAIVRQLLEQENLEWENTALISPYSGQIAAAKELFAEKLRCSTIDSFQGQEQQVVIVSLVRSNEDGEIGFLKDYRRMNVAITRAKEQLFVIGDSATVGNDPFFNAFLMYVEKQGVYRTIWEFEL